MAEIVVFLHSGEQTFGEGSRFQVLDSGVLQVTDAPNKREVYFGASAWTRVEKPTSEVWGAYV